MDKRESDFCLNAFPSSVLLAYLQVRSDVQDAFHEAKEDVRVDAPLVSFVQHDEAAPKNRGVCVYVCVRESKLSTGSSA
jgi:hypothetical protein